MKYPKLGEIFHFDSFQDWDEISYNSANQGSSIGIGNLVPMEIIAETYPNVLFLVPRAVQLTLAFFLEMAGSNNRSQHSELHKGLD